MTSGTSSRSHPRLCDGQALGNGQNSYWPTGPDLLSRLVFVPGQEHQDPALAGPDSKILHLQRLLILHKTANSSSSAYATCRIRGLASYPVKLIAEVGQAWPPAYPPAYPSAYPWLFARLGSLAACLPAWLPTCLFSVPCRAVPCRAMPCRAVRACVRACGRACAAYDEISSHHIVVISYLRACERACAVRWRVLRAWL